MYDSLFEYANNLHNKTTFRLLLIMEELTMQKVIIQKKGHTNGKEGSPHSYSEIKFGIEPTIGIDSFSYRCSYRSSTNQTGQN